MKQEIEERIERLTRLMGTDEGFYILALHSFVEYFLRYEKKYGEGPSFPELTWKFREELLDRYGGGFVEGLYCLGRLGKQHAFANKVRHAFEEMDVEEARTATHLFLTFCKLAGIAAVPGLGQLQQHLDLWKDRSSPLEKSVVIRHMQQELEKLKLVNRGLLEQKEDYDRMKSRLREMQRSLEGYDDRIREKEKISAHRDARLEELRAERRTLIEERNGLMEQLGRYDRLETYLRYLGRLSIYTRTRMEYEQSVGRLTPEQEEAVEAVRLKGHFLIRGGAGTGKSLVLIESLRRAALQNELHFREGEQALLVTFTRTLANYNRYISELRGMKIPLDVIDTIDRFFQSCLELFIPGLEFDFSFLQNYLRDRITGEREFISAEELTAEIEEFIFAFGLDRKEYLDTTVSRRGMRRRLNREQRKTVWDIAVKASREMARTGVYTKNYSRLVLLRFLETTPGSTSDTMTASAPPVPRNSAVPTDPTNTEKIPVPLRTESAVTVPSIRYLFLDEVQDLNPSALKILRLMTTGAMVMAGDPSQSLYVYYSPFARSGINLRGSTRILKTNFRNTRQIHDLAMSFRRRGVHSAENDLPDTNVFREGPAPEIYSAATDEELIKMLIDKLLLFTGDLGYSSENICVLVPRRVEILRIQQAMDSGGILSEDVRSEDFSFHSTGRVRLSTLHSSKGLDFPVVLLYLPYLYRRAFYADRETDQLLRNLLFVGITRAMDNLNIFMRENNDPILQDLRNSFEEKLSTPYQDSPGAESYAPASIRR